MPKVWNKRDPNIPKDAIYVGRPSKWGNQHPIGYCRLCGERHNREEAISMYSEDLMQQENIVQLIVNELKGKDLICWCAPKACHADLLLEIANS